MERQAVVTLFPIDEKEALPFRSLTFTSADDTFSVGRASTREEKNMVPEHHNAYFDSRVMSRQHATLGVSTDMKNFYVRDSGSMHGTFVNGKKIASDKNYTIKSGDVMTFGTSVTSGNETFKPVKVRCEYEWFDDRHDRNSKPNIERKTNKFSVPDDDDDVEVVEVIDTTIIAGVENARSVGDDAGDSEGWSDDEEDADAEQSSPVTSPSSERFSHCKGEAEITGEPDDDELPMISIYHQTSTSVAGPNEIATVVQHEESRVAVCSVELSSEPADSNHVSDEGHDLEQLDDQSDIASNDEPGDPSDDENVYDKMDRVYEEIFSAAANSIDEPGSAQVEHEIGGGTPKFTSVPEWETRGTQRATSDPSLPKHSFDCPPMQTSEPLLSVYQDGPFVDGAALARATPPAAAVSFITPEDLGSMKQNKLSHESQVSKSAEVSMKFRQSQVSEAIGINQTVNPNDCLSSPNKPAKQRTGFSIADLVDAKPTSSLNPEEPRKDGQKSSKRKASCLDSDLDGNDSLASVSPGSLMAMPVLRVQDHVANSPGSYSQDAQPRVALDTLSQASSEVSALNHVEHVPVAISTPIHPPPAKRVKTNEPTRAKSLVSHAATAIVGAIVGGLSTVALLASLPPDYFN